MRNRNLVILNYKCTADLILQVCVHYNIFLCIWNYLTIRTKAKSLQGMGARFFLKSNDFLESYLLTTSTLRDSLLHIPLILSFGASSVHLFMLLIFYFIQYTYWKFTIFSQAGELAENVAKIIDSQLADAVDMSEVQVSTVFYLFIFCNIFCFLQV